MKNEQVNLADYDYIVVNSSAGKDSQAMLDYVVRLAEIEGVKDRVVVVHCDLGEVEWEGCRELAEEHARHYGVRFEVVSRVHKQGGLLVQIEQRGMFPSNTNRYCTSDQKTGQVATLLTALVREWEVAQGGVAGKSLRPCRILQCLGIRADESPARAKKCPFGPDAKASNGRRDVTRWLPIFHWSVDMVWSRIKRAGTRHHFAYDLGMPRLSCCFCIFAPRPALLLAGFHNRGLLRKYVQIEDKIGHTLRQDQSLREIEEALEAGERPSQVQDWEMPV